MVYRRRQRSDSDLSIPKRASFNILDRKDRGAPVLRITTARDFIQVRLLGQAILAKITRAANDA